MSKTAVLSILVVILAIVGLILFLNLRNQGKSTTATFNSLFEKGGEVTIKMGEEGYDPSKITIKKGQVVTFENAGSSDRWPASNIHPTHQIYPEFDPRKPVVSGESWSFKFEKAGIWRFHDHLSPQLTGVITVE